MVSTETVQADVVVVGGGLAGCTAAIAAARLGSRVHLITNRPVLGGNSSSEVRVWVVGATAHGVQRFARETGIMGEFFLENQYRNPEGNPIYWDQVLLDAVRAESNITLHLNTDVHEVDVAEDGAIRSVSGWAMLTETWYTFAAPVFIDATGDGLVGALSGAEYMLGREGREEYGEEWAPEQGDSQLLGSSMFFYSKDTGCPQRYVAPNHAVDIEQTPILANRVIRTGDNGCAYWWIEWGGHLDIVKDSDRIRDELSGVVFGVWDYIKNSGNFEAENHTLEWVGQIPGRREYRRLKGDYVLTQQDLMEQRQFPDVAGYGGWSIDLHPVEGMYATAPGARQRYSQGIYQIPFRCLHSVNVPNLLMAGRDISATHIAEGSARVMATCAVLGQAAGTAASMMSRGAGAGEIAAQPQVLQQTLLREDAALVGVRADDPQDLLRGARVTASSWRRSISSELVQASECAAEKRDDAAASVSPAARHIPLDRDLAIALPVNACEQMRLLVDAPGQGELTLEYWSSERPENYVPSRLLARHTVSLSGPGRQWLTIPGISSTQPSAAAGEGEGTQARGCVEAHLIAVMKAAEGVALPLTDRYPYGSLLMRRKAEDSQGFDDRIPDEPGQLLTTWVARDLRGSMPVFELVGAPDVYAPQAVRDGWQRPYGGPHMWMSEFNEALVAGEGEEWLECELEQPREVASVRVIFNDDVDADLINLHHHSTPWLVAPTLITDYAIEARLSGSDEWVELARVTGNRHRHAIHDVDPVTVSALRLRMTRSGGAPYASVVAIKAYGEASGRDASPWR